MLKQWPERVAFGAGRPERALAAKAPRPISFFFLSDDTGWRGGRLQRGYGSPTLTMNSIAREGAKLTGSMCSPCARLAKPPHDRYAWKNGMELRQTGLPNRACLATNDRPSPAKRGICRLNDRQMAPARVATARLAPARGFHHHSGFYRAGHEEIRPPAIRHLDLDRFQIRACG